MALIRILDDNSTMPIGKHKGKKMADVPFDYLLWYEGTEPLKKGQVYDYMVESDRAVRTYIADNKDALPAGQKQARQYRRNTLFNPYQ